MLRGIDVELRRGTLVRFHGSNGTGKSTLLRMLAGTDSPSEGRVEGRPRRVAYVPERFPGALPLTALGYVTHLGRIHGLRRGEAKARAGEWLERLGAAEHARTPVSELSKGTAQKVAVAQALVAAPQLLVLDEAWTGLDAAARDELDRSVAERVAAGATVAFVDHDPQRLVRAVDVAYRLEAHGLVPAEPPSLEAGSESWVRIVAVGPVGAIAPAGLPGAPSVTAGPDGTTELTVASVHSDGVLRALLGARPAWHVRAVSPTPDQVQRPTPVRERNQP
ncbi:ATP-binding cassette domain-containing protein [Streptomyces candidus]|uniref:ABC-type multidrug transport system ATPase subunit n=1 Tax=Streptomyces candidus TaxID=67283 RepID=A0A7X0LMG8_9ACTN|nr:ATP-binding cassette domain-containing protein [Streptomyces candidus]MBB6434398.1 ABC-type multidrug transport system ATPase subunit [Streptomyces candidus]GHH36843.1 ABC transporter ATP-binding protein [Streptomyces candidus]